MTMPALQTEPHPRLWTGDEFEQLCRLGFFRGETVDLIDGVIARQRPWSKDEAYRLSELGFFQGQKAELLGGEIMVASPQDAAHFAALDRVAKVLGNAWVGRVWVREQGPLGLGLITEPEPDVSVVPGERADYALAHPTAALLVVEVSESSLAYDRGDKASLYAAGAVRDYWIVDLIHQTLEVRRDPVADPTQRHGFAYTTVTILHRAQSVTPLALPTVLISVADLLP